jgi:hypothetical protein
MFTTAVVAFVFGSTMIAQFVLWFFLLKAGARWAKIEGVTTGRAMLAILLICFAQLAISVVYLVDQPILPAAALFTAIGMIALNLLLPLMLIRAVFRASWRQALLAWLPTLLAPVLGVLLASSRTSTGRRAAGGFCDRALRRTLFRPSQDDILLTAQAVSVPTDPMSME